MTTEERAVAAAVDWIRENLTGMARSQVERGISEAITRALASRRDPVDPAISKFATRLLSTQPVWEGTAAMGAHGAPGPVPSLHVAAALHGLADFTHLQHIVAVAETRAMARPTDDDFAPAAISLGRYFHALADEIEDRWRTTGSRCDPEWGSSRRRQCCMS